MILKILAWTWLVIVFVTILTLAVWQVVTNLSGFGGFLGFMWITGVLLTSIGLSLKIVLSK